MLTVVRVFGSVTPLRYVEQVRRTRRTHIKESIMIDIDHGNSPDAHVASPPFDTKKPQP